LPQQIFFVFNSLLLKKSKSAKFLKTVCPPGFRIPDYKDKNNNSKNLTFFPVLSISILSLLFHIFFIHFISLPSSFSISPRSSRSFLYIHSTLLNCLSFLIAHSAPSFLSFHPLLVFSFLVPTSSFFFLLHSLSPGTAEFPLADTSHTFCYIWILGFFPFFLACLCSCPFHSALHSSIFL
jgi:hypothetical protein